MKRPCLPLLAAVQAPTTKILPTKCLNIAEPRIFCPRKLPAITYAECYSLSFVFGEYVATAAVAIKLLLYDKGGCLS